MSRAYAIAVMCVICSDKVNHADGEEVGQRPNGLKALVHTGQCARKWKKLSNLQRDKLLQRHRPSAEESLHGPLNGHITNRIAEIVNTEAPRTRPRRPYAPEGLLVWCAKRTRGEDHGWNTAALLQAARKEPEFQAWLNGDERFPPVQVDTFRNAVLNRCEKYWPQISLDEAINRFAPPPAPPAPVVEETPAPSAPPSDSWQDTALSQLADLVSQGLRLLVTRGRSDTVKAAAELVLREVTA